MLEQKGNIPHLFGPKPGVDNGLITYSAGGNRG